MGVSKNEKYDTSSSRDFLNKDKMAGYTAEQVSAFRRTFTEYTDHAADGLVQSTFREALNKCLSSIGFRPLTEAEAVGQFKQISQNSVVQWPQFFQVRHSTTYLYRGVGLSRVSGWVLKAARAIHLTVLQPGEELSLCTGLRAAHFIN